MGTTTRTLAGSPCLQYCPGPEFTPEVLRRSALCQGGGPTHLDEIKAGQEGDAVLDHFALWPLLRRHPGRLPGSASSSGRGVHSAAEASSLLQPQAPGAADVTFPAGTAGASALHAAPPPSPLPSLQQPSGSLSRQVLFLPCSGSCSWFSRERRPAPSSKLLLQWLLLPCHPPWLSTALARLQGCGSLTSRFGKGGRSPGVPAVSWLRS